jgi:hypothetical protein
MYRSTYLDLGTSCRSVVSFTTRPLYPRERNSRNSLDRRLGGPQNRSGRGGEEKNLTILRKSNSHPSVVQPVASRYTDYTIYGISGNYKQKFNDCHKTISRSTIQIKLALTFNKRRILIHFN